MFFLLPASVAQSQTKKPAADNLYYFYGPDSLIGVRNAKGAVVIQPLYHGTDEDPAKPITEEIITLYRRTKADTVLGYEKFVHFFNRKGEFLLHPYWFDNGPDYLEEGLRRFVEGTKMGFADRYGTKKIPAVYGYVSSFNYGVAFVCEGCKFYRDTTADPEHNQRIGPGKWSVINKEGVKLMDIESTQPDYRSWDSLATTVASFNYTPYEKEILKKVEAIPNVKKYLVQNHVPEPTGVRFQIVEKPSKSFPYYLIKSFGFHNGVVTDLNTEFLVTTNGKAIYRWWGHLDEKDPVADWIKESKDWERENTKK